MNKSNFRALTDEEVANCVKLIRHDRKWSQEQLAAISGLNLRTIQRVEKGEPSSIDTRRNLANSFGANDIDAFNKETNIFNTERNQLNGYSPKEFISSVNPIVIIDEPQSVDNTDKAKGKGENHH